MSTNSPANEGPGTAELKLARWSHRFFAWLIDFVIVYSVLWALFTAASVPFWFDGVSGDWFDNPNDAARWALTSLVFLGYWTYFESTTGQSLGKMALKIRTTNLVGGKVDIRNAAIQSFGKAFLLPIDVILGWIFTNDKRQRVFSRFGETIVIKQDKQTSGDSGVRYTKE
jgi:uncharacterized RDD family membrane protein YckC